MLGKRLLTKSQFTRALDCVRRPWLDVYRKDLRAPISISLQDRFDTGRALGELARFRYPNGRLIDHPGYDGTGAVEETQAALASGEQCVFEATFIANDRLARVDVLHKTPDASAWTIDEVKSSTVKDPAKIGTDKVLDLAFQVQTARDAGIPVERARLVLVDSTFTWDGTNYDPIRFFGEVDMTDACEKALPKVTEHAGRLQQILASAAEPEVELNTQCKDCEYFGHCHLDSPKHDLIFLPQILPKVVTKLREKGYRSIADIPEDEPLTDNRRRMRDVIVSGKPYIGPGLAQDLATISFPAAFIDYESTNAAFPTYPNTRPYQPICFQWSAHVLDGPESVPVHREFLPEGREDPRAEFCRTLWETIKDCPAILHYSPFEKTQLRFMIDSGIPFAQELFDALEARSVDLEKVIREHVYMEGFNGRTTIKVVLPTMVPGMSYDHLAIQEGMAAAGAFRRMLDPTTATEEAAQLRRDLLAYCCQDTLAMVEIYRALRKLA